MNGPAPLGPGGVRALQRERAARRAAERRAARAEAHLVRVVALAERGLPPDLARFLTSTEPAETAAEVDRLAAALAGMTDADHVLRHR